MTNVVDLSNKEKAFSELERVCEIYTEEVYGYERNLSIDRYEGRMTSGEEWWLLVRHDPSDSGTYVVGLPASEVISFMEKHWSNVEKLESLCDEWSVRDAKKYKGEYIDIVRAHVLPDYLFEIGETLVRVSYG